LQQGARAAAFGLSAPQPSGFPMVGKNESPKPKAEAKAKAANAKPLLAAKIVEVRDTYGKMSAKARHARIHNGPLQLRKALPPRDTTEWVRSMKQPYSYFESSANEPTPKPEKSKGPPQLWLPMSRLQKLQLERNASDKEKEKEKEKPSLAEYDERTLGRPPWDEGHHIMVSRMNNEVQSGVREYFDKPKRKEGEGIPRMRERYAMSDRQLAWYDEPGKPGEMRRTVLDSVGAYNIGGCKDYQLPSYWRKVKDWSSLSSPTLPLELRQKTQPYGHTPALAERRTLYQALANMPAAEATLFWRGWVEREDGFAKAEAAVSPSQKTRWNNSWQVCAQGNDEMNWRCREYFSVPLGGTGRSMARSVPLLKQPLATTLEEALEEFHLNESP